LKIAPEARQFKRASESFELNASKKGMRFKNFHYPIVGISGIGIEELERRIKRGKQDQEKNLSFP
jgi:hypothetical protein